METNEVVVLPSEVAEIAKNVSVEKRNEVQSVLNYVFNGVAKMREQLDLVAVVDENDKVNMRLANTIRLGVRQVRLDAEKTFDAKRTEVQQQMLSFKTEDSLWLKAKQTMQILTKEIEENARWKEETKERHEAQQKELRTQARIEKIRPLNPELNRMEFENMSEEMFSIFLSGIEKSFNDRIEAEKKAEAERLRLIEEDRKERERINAENERLKKEAERKEKELEIERKKQAQILADQQAKAKAEREESERVLLAERKAADEKLKTEQEEARKLAAELQAKKEAELKAQAEAERKEKERIATEQKAAKAPDKEKMTRWIDSLNIAVPELSTINAMATANVISEKFDAFKNWAKQQIETI